MQTMINKYQVEGNQFAFLSFWVCPLQIFLCWKMKLKFLKSPSPHLAFSKADEEVDGCPHALKRLYVSVKCSPHVLSGIYTAPVQNNDYHILLISTNKYWFCFDFALFIYFHIQAGFFFHWLCNNTIGVTGCQYAAAITLLQLMWTWMCSKSLHLPRPLPVRAVRLVQHVQTT